jgi:hypothetical protein
MDALIFGLIPLIVTIVFISFSYSFPSKEKELRNIEEVAKNYRKYSLLFVVPFVALGILFTFLFYFLIKRLAYYHFSSIDNFILLVVEEDAIWMLPALFLGIMASYFPLTLLSKLLLKEKYDDIMAYSESLYKFDGVKALKVFCISILSMCFLFIILSLDWYTRFTEDSLVENKFFSFTEVTKEYIEIQNIYKASSFQAPNGDIYNGPFYVFDFGDGYLWSTRNKKITVDEFEQEVLTFILIKSNKDVKEILFENDIVKY